MKTNINRSGLKVLHIAETIQGGVATYLETLEAISPHRNHYLIPGAQATGTTLPSDKQMHFNGTGRLSRARYLFAAIHHCLKQGDYDLLHLHSSLAGYAFVLRRLLFLKSPPAIFCAHGWAFLRQTSRMEHFVSKFLDFLTGIFSSGIIHISHTEKDRANFIFNSHQAVIYNPVDPAYISSPPNTGDRPCNTILFVGRLDFQKGFDVLYQAFNNPLLKDYRLIVAGTSVLAATHYSQTPNIQFLGWQSKHSLAELYERVSLTIMPSRWEGFGLVAIESLSRGTPVLVNQAGSLPEVVFPVGLVADLSSEEKVVQYIQQATRLPQGYSPEVLQHFVTSRFSPMHFSQQINTFYERVLCKSI